VQSTVDLQDKGSPPGERPDSIEVAAPSGGIGPVLLVGGPLKAVATAEPDEINLGERMGTTVYVSQGPPHDLFVPHLSGLVEGRLEVGYPGEPLLDSSRQQATTSTRVCHPHRSIHQRPGDPGLRRPAYGMDVGRSEPARLVDNHARQRRDPRALGHEYVGCLAFPTDESSRFGCTEPSQTGRSSRVQDSDPPGLQSSELAGVQDHDPRPGQPPSPGHQVLADGPPGHPTLTELRTAEDRACASARSRKPAQLAGYA
jgi:hypothetical protein